MVWVGTVKRIVRKPDQYYWLWIPIFYSESEKRYHRVLPAFLAAFKHYTVKTITDAVNDDQELDQYDLPSDSSRIRWKDLVPGLLHRLSELKRSADPSSLPVRLQSILSSGLIDLVEVDSTTHRFSTAELGSLLFLPIYKRL